MTIDLQEDIMKPVLQAVAKPCNDYHQCDNHKWVQTIWKKHRMHHGDRSTSENRSVLWVRNGSQKKEKIKGLTLAGLLSG